MSAGLMAFAFALATIGSLAVFRAAVRARVVWWFAIQFPILAGLAAALTVLFIVEIGHGVVQVVTIRVLAWLWMIGFVVTMFMLAWHFNRQAQALGVLKQAAAR